MLLGVIADDYTGASDIANTLAKGHRGPGLATTQFLGVPACDTDSACEAGVVALKSRSIPAVEAVALSLDALDWLRRQGCRQFLFKYCSTFDSTPEGNRLRGRSRSGVPCSPGSKEGGASVRGCHRQYVCGSWPSAGLQGKLALCDPERRR